MASTARGNCTMDPVTGEGIATRRKKNPPPLSSLRNPTFEFLDSNYKKSELQKFGSQLQLEGIWTKKEKLIEILIKYFSTLNRPSTSTQRSATEDSQVKQNEDALPDLVERFEIFTGASRVYEW